MQTWAEMHEERGRHEMIKSSDRAAAARAMQAMMEMGKLDIAALKRAYQNKPGA